MVPICSTEKYQDAAGEASGIRPNFGRFRFALVLFHLFCLQFANPVFLHAQTGNQSQNLTPHPSVVRVAAKHGQVTSFGSGTLVAKKTNYGFILTNWHVVCDSNGYVTVRFPDKQEFGAAVVAVDDRWDLALLIIPEPKNVAPVPISPTIPQNGETYWVAGYRGGDGAYRIRGGRLASFQRPEPDIVEPELIEIDVPVESGESGGPVFNRKYELAGVLFASDNAMTMASHCGRVIKFLEQAAPQVAALPASPEPVIKAASLSQQSILQKGGLSASTAMASGTGGDTRLNTLPSSVSSSSSSFGASGIRSRNAIQPTASQQIVRITRHGFLGLQYDLSAANALLAAESRAGTGSRTGGGTLAGSGLSGSNTSGGFQLGGTGTTSGASSGGTNAAMLAGTNATPAAGAGYATGYSPGSSTNNTLAGGSASGTTSRVAQPVTPRTASPGYGTTSVAATNSTTSSTGSGARSGAGYGLTSTTGTTAASETIPTSASRYASSPAAASPAYGNNAARGNNNSYGNTPANGNVGGTSNGRTSGAVSGTYTPSQFQRKTDTAPGGTRGGTGGNAGAAPSGYNSYGNNMTSPTSTGVGGSRWANDTAVSQYALDAADMQSDDVAPKYGDEFVAEPGGPEVTGAGSKFDAVKIVIAILVIFFILFHTIKTMAIAEERQ